MSGFVYVWRDKKRNMYYVGCHWGSETDSYVCSSERMRSAYRRRPQDFKRRIVQRVYTNRQELLTEEHKWLSRIKDEELGKKFYNLNKHHFGHWSANPKKYESMVERNTGSRNPMYGRIGNRSPRYGMKWSSEQKERFSKTRTGMRMRNKGKPLSEEHKKALRVPKKNARNQSGAENHMHGGKWITDGSVNIFLKANQQLPTGFRYGRTMRNK